MAPDASTSEEWRKWERMGCLAKRDFAATAERYYSSIKRCIIAPIAHSDSLLVPTCSQHVSSAVIA